MHRIWRAPGEFSQEYIVIQALKLKVYPEASGRCSIHLRIRTYRYITDKAPLSSKKLRRARDLKGSHSVHTKDLWIGRD